MPRASVSVIEMSRSGTDRPSWASVMTSAGSSASRDGGSRKAALSRPVQASISARRQRRSASSGGTASPGLPEDQRRLIELDDAIAKIRTQIATADLARQRGEKPIDPDWFHRARTALRHLCRERADSRPRHRPLSPRKAQGRADRHPARTP